MSSAQPGRARAYAALACKAGKCQGHFLRCMQACSMHASQCLAPEAGEA